MDMGVTLSIIWALAATLIVIILYVRGKKALAIFPDIDSVHVVYQDTSASGFSTTSWFARLGGAGSVLDVVVTDKELWLSTKILFAGAGQQSDLVHRIPLTNIKRVAVDGKKIGVDFTSMTGEDKQFVLITQRQNEFLAAIQNSTQEEPS